MLRTTTACTFSTSQLPKVVRDRQCFTFLTWTCASRHNGVHFLSISPSKSGNVLRATTACTFSASHLPKVEMCFGPQRRALFQHLIFQEWSENVTFFTFDLDMCFAPQRRTLFRHLHFQKRSEAGVLCTF